MINFGIHCGLSKTETVSSTMGEIFDLMAIKNKSHRKDKNKDFE